ncbi:transcription termination/antitermination protein NusG [Helicobacter sp. 11S02629-2]|uniref:transcription termination/antitermination protein NusG n=1 Tax=Helicobacter sp. 11S02629-2 TaxID=1476195 RepID=UPI000BD9DFBE|nr:transcription termination/antitermination protein NusG [Helicobacter sp. 11S02629-2]PAF45816.1 transcription termination/antitermination protein NusG [Helicobacter sp. 11S02629-2]
MQTYSGSEQAVKRSIENLALNPEFKDKIKDVILPTEDVYEIKDKKKKVTQKSLYPGYVFINVYLDVKMWHVIQSLPKVGRFIGESKKPTPLREEEINHILEKALNRPAPRPKIFFDVGENIRIIDGPFSNFTAVVETYDIRHKKLVVNVSIFGRNTPVELSYTQVEKII